MNIENAVSKLNRWINIWMSQYAVSSKENKRCESSDSVLLIKIDAIGDFIIWLDSAKEYRNVYPDKKLVLLCNGICADIAERTGYFDDIITLNIRKFESDKKYMHEQLEKLSGYEFGTLVQTAYSRTVHMDILAQNIRAAEKIGMVCDESRINLSRSLTTRNNRKILDSIYDRLINVPGEFLMEVKRNGQFVNGISSYKYESALPVFPKCDIDSSLIPNDNYYILFPGSSTPKKMWNLAGYAQLAEYVYNKTGWVGYVCGSKSEQLYYDQIKSNLSSQVKLESMCGATSLLELAEVIRSAKLIISNDTSGIHYAAATNTPSICISGEYHIGRFLPYDYDKKNDSEYEKRRAPMIVCSANMPCRRCSGGKLTRDCKKSLATCGRYQCMEKVDVKQVIAAIDSVLGVINE